MRRALAAVPVLALLTPVASAAPSGGPEQGQDVTLQVRTAHGTAVLALLASTPVGGGAARLRVRLDHGDVQDRWYGELPPGALSSAGSVTTLRTKLGRVPLVVRWTAEPESLAVDGGSHRVGPTSAAGWSAVGTSGTVRVQLGPVRCAIRSATIGAVVAYDTGAGDPGLSSPLGLDLRGARCSDLPDALPPVP